MKQWLLLKIVLPLFLMFTILEFMSTQWKETGHLQDFNTDFNKMLKKNSEMCDAAIQSVFHIISHETYQKARHTECLKILFGWNYTLINRSKPISENGTCKKRSHEDIEIFVYRNMKECLNMIEIEEHLAGIYEEMVQLGKEISAIKDEFADITEANCSGREDEETCKLQIMLSVKSHVVDLLVQARVNMNIVNEIISLHRENSAVCFEAWNSFKKIRDDIINLCTNGL